MGIGLLNPVYSRMGPDVTVGGLSCGTGTSTTTEGRCDLETLLSRELCALRSHTPMGALTAPTGSQEGINKFTSSPQFSPTPTPTCGHSPWPNPRHILSVPFSPLYRHFLPVSSSSPSGLFLDDYERCSSCPRLPITPPVSAPGAETAYKLPTITFRKSNTPAGTQGQDRAF